MGGLLSFLIAVGGLLLVLGIGGALWGLVGRTKFIKRWFSKLYHNLPMGRKEVNDLSLRQSR